MIGILASPDRAEVTAFETMYDFPLRLDETPVSHGHLFMIQRSVG